jgi:hypothetical protein
MNLHRAGRNAGCAILLGFALFLLLATLWLGIHH